MNSAPLGVHERETSRFKLAWPWLLVPPLLLFTLYVTGIGHFIHYGSLAPLRWHSNPISANSSGERWLAGIVFGCVFVVPVFAIAAAGRFTKLAEHSTKGRTAAGLLALVGCLIAAYNIRMIELDDKWAYYRTSLNVLRHGLPYWNPQDPLNINTSFAWPYIASLGHLFGNWNYYVQFIGLLSVLVAAFLFLKYLPGKVAPLAGLVGVLLYLPAILWGLGGMETTIATLYTLAVVIALIRNPDRLLLWFLLGCEMFVRPDVVLLGAGAYGMFFIFGPAPWSRKVACGAAFAAAILGFIAFNKVVFGPPLPSSYYVKGLNKAFSGHYPLSVDIRTGAVHFLSSLAVSLPFTVALLGALGAIAFRPRLLREPAAWIIAGAFVHAAYFIACGYQHMGFMFRYWIPGLIPLYYATLHLISRASEGSGPNSWIAPLPKSILAIGLFAQLPLTLLYAGYARVYDIGLTRANLRDDFSVQSYADWMTTWLKAGEYMKNVFKASDKVFFFQNTAGVALSDAYAIDQFYMPFATSSYAAIRNNPLQIVPYDYRDFDYIIGFGDLNFGKSFHLFEPDPNYINSPYDIGMDLKRIEPGTLGAGRTMMIYRRRSDWRQILSGRH